MSLMGAWWSCWCFSEQSPGGPGILLARMLALVFYAVSGFHRKNTIHHLTMAFGREKE